MLSKHIYMIVAANIDPASSGGLTFRTHDHPAMLMELMMLLMPTHRLQMLVELMMLLIPMRRLQAGMRLMVACSMLYIVT